MPARDGAGLTPSAAPAPAMKDHPLPDMRGVTLGSTVGLLPGDVVTVIGSDGSERNHVYRPEDEVGAAPLPPCPLSEEELASMRRYGTPTRDDWTNSVRAIAWIVDALRARVGS